MNGLVMNKSLNGYKSPGRGYTYEDVQMAANYLTSRTKCHPKIGIICGSGLSSLAEEVEEPEYFPYADIPHFPISTVPGHVGRLVFGKLKGKLVVCMQGRVHAYEGYSMWKISFPVRVFHALGVKLLIATNASGGLNPEYKVGDFMIMKDHINLPGLTGNNPLVGLHDDRLGSRFTPMSDCYDQDLRLLAQEITKELDFDFVREGVYVVQVGPTFESVAECRLMKLLGADVTGMSTVPEVIVAKQCGMRVFAMSLITNTCVVDYDTGASANHAEVLETGRMRALDMQRFISEMVKRMEVV